MRSQSSAGPATRRCASTARASTCRRCRADGRVRPERRPRRYPRVLEPELRRTLGHRHERAAPLGSAPVLQSRRAGPALPGGAARAELAGHDAGPRDRRVDAGRRDLRRRAAPEQIAARVLRPGARARRGLPGHRSGRRPGRLRGAVPRGRATPSTSRTSIRELPFEFRYLGDNSITETYAFLLQHLVENPEWLARHLNIDDASELAAPCARLPARSICAGTPARSPTSSSSTAPRRRRIGRARRALRRAARRGAGIEWPRENFVSDVDPGFYSACYLRAWALETHLRSYLRDGSDRPGSMRRRPAMRCAPCGARSAPGRRGAAGRADRRAPGLRRRARGPGPLLPGARGRHGRADRRHRQRRAAAGSGTRPASRSNISAIRM